MIQIRRLASTDTNFNEALGQLLAFEDSQDAMVEATVGDILADIKKRGDEALLDYTRRFDHLVAASTAELELPHDRLQKALDSLPANQRNALLEAASRVRAYHEKQ
ncbi:MAG TPA: histidinol dehydrogenase, partial [Nitrosospira sp.]|nr:histidinol dehydrogenase [Nitrosospira sp.]